MSTARTVELATSVFCVTTAPGVELDAALFDWMVHVPTLTVQTRDEQADTARAGRPDMVAPLLPVKLSQPTTVGADTVEVTFMAIRLLVVTPPSETASATPN